MSWWLTSTRARSKSQPPWCSRSVGVRRPGGGRPDVTGLSPRRSRGDQFGQLDILVNNAAVGDPRSMWDLEQRWDRVYAVNVKGMFFCLRRVARHMREARSGKIVNLASSAGELGSPNHLHYAATKAAVINVTRSGLVGAGAVRRHRQLRLSGDRRDGAVGPGRASVRGAGGPRWRTSCASGWRRPRWDGRRGRMTWPASWPSSPPPTRILHLTGQAPERHRGPGHVLSRSERWASRARRGRRREASWSANGDSPAGDRRDAAPG